MSVITEGLVKSISKNVAKHEKTVSACQAKLNTIKDIVSKALDDDKISAEEFRLIKSEVEKYHEMKRSLRRKHVKQIRQGPSETEIKKMQNQIRADILKKLGAPPTAREA